MFSLPYMLSPWHASISYLLSFPSMSWSNSTEVDLEGVHELSTVSSGILVDKVFVLCSRHQIGSCLGAYTGGPVDQNSSQVLQCEFIGIVKVILGCNVFH